MRILDAAGQELKIGMTVSRPAVGRYKAASGVIVEIGLEAPFLPAIRLQASQAPRRYLGSVDTGDPADVYRCRELTGVQA